VYTLLMAVDSTYITLMLHFLTVPLSTCITIIMNEPVNNNELL